MGVLKNDVGRPSNKTIKIRFILKAVLLIVVAGGLFLGGYLLNDKTNNNRLTPESNEVDFETYKLANSLFEKMNRYSNWLDLIETKGITDNFSYKYFYTKDKVTNSQVSDAMKFAIAYGEYFENEVEPNVYGELDNIYLSDINKYSQKIFNSDVDIDKLIFYDEDLNEWLLDFEIEGIVFHYNKEEQKIYEPASAGIGDAASADIITKIVDVNRDKNKIEIINKVMFSYSGPSENGWEFKLFKTATNDIDNGYSFGLKDEIADLSDEDIDFDDIIIDDYIDKLDSFKWTFTKNSDGEYIFTSVEKVKGE